MDTHHDTHHNELHHNELQRFLRIAVYAMLAISAAAVFLLGDRLWAAARVGDLPLWAPLIAPGAFTAFVSVYAVDRWLLVRRHQYPVARAFFQIGFAVIFLSLLWPRQASELRLAHATGRETDAAVRLLDSPNRAVRAMACEVLGWRGQSATRQEVERLAREDPTPEVRAACAAAAPRIPNNATPPPQTTPP